MSPERSFIADGPASDVAAASFDADVTRDGFVMNLTRIWAHVPEALPILRSLMLATADAAGLDPRQRAVLVSAGASAIGDSYCSLAWGTKLASQAGPDAARSVIASDDVALPATDRVLARWARRVASAPNDVAPSDVAELRAAGFDDGRIAALTMFVALRLAFSTFNDALGIRPDAELVERAPGAVRDAVAFGREPESSEGVQRARSSAAC